MKSFHRLLDWCFVIPPVNLVEIDVIRSETTKGTIDGIEQVLPRKSLAVRPLSDCEKCFRRDHHLLPRDKFAEGPAEDFLAFAKRVHIRRIKEIYAGFDRFLKKRPRLILRQYPG